MIESMLQYSKNVFKNYEKLMGLLIFTIFFNLFLYLKDIVIIFELSNLNFSFKNLAIFLIFVLSFISFIFLFLITLLIILDYIKNILKLKKQIFVSSFIVLLNSIFIFYIILNLKVFKLLGVHLHDKIAIKAFNVGGIRNDISLNFETFLNEMIKPSIIFSLGILTYFLLSFLIKKAKLVKKLSNMTYLIVYPILFSIFLSLYFWSKMNSLATLVPVWSFLKTGSMLKHIESSYDNNIKNVKLNNKKNIVIVISESLREDVFNKNNMPNMFKFIEKNKDSTIIPKYSFSGSHFTLYSIFSIWYSVWSYNYRIFTSFTKYKDSAAIKLFRNLGYRSIFLTASHILEYDESFKQVTKQFDKYQEFISDRKMMDSFKKQYNESLSKDDKPFIVFLFIYASHFSYRYPKKFKKYYRIIIQI